MDNSGGEWSVIGAGSHYETTDQSAIASRTVHTQPTWVLHSVSLAARASGIAAAAGRDSGICLLGSG